LRSAGGPSVDTKSTLRLAVLERLALRRTGRVAVIPFPKRLKELEKIKVVAIVGRYPESIEQI
jgi:hypothetical protein